MVKRDCIDSLFDALRIITHGFTYYDAHGYIENMLSLLLGGFLLENTLGHRFYVSLYLIPIMLSGAYINLFYPENVLCSGAVVCIYAITSAGSVYFYDIAKSVKDYILPVIASIGIVLSLIPFEYDTPVKLIGCLWGILLTCYSIKTKDEVTNEKNN